jgi:NAD(P)-dependent dehydrogenase (short-subunit alcohol dehydrogenase family)
VSILPRRDRVADGQPAWTDEPRTTFIPMAEPSRLIVLTGVSRGLGRAMAAGFVAHGHTICGCARSSRAIDELRAQWPAPHRFDVVDITDDAAVGRWAQTVLGEHGPPDLLINNAAVINRNARLWEVPCEEFAEVMRVNVVGMHSVLRHFVPAMVRRGSGVIVNFSSAWGRTTSPEVAPYCASKFAVEGLTQALAQELPQGMAAVPLNPGIIHTEMLESCFGSGARQYPSPQQWAEQAVPFILGLGPRHNGQPLSVPQ